VLTSELIRVGLFVGAVVAVYVTAAGLVIRAVIRRLRGGPAPGRAEAWARRIGIPLAGLGLLCFAYGYLVEPYSLEVTRVRIGSPRLPAGTRPIRLVLFSDLHSDPAPRLEEVLPEAIAAEKPDLIVFTGDAVNSMEALPVFRECLERISRIAPTFAVEGNWDTRVFGGRDIYGGTGARLLDGGAARVEVEGADLWLAGVPVGGEDRLEMALAGVPAGACTVFLYHMPDLVYDVARRRVDLYCAGHTHGGQVALPFYGALMTLSRFGKRFEAGLFRVEDTWLYVNRGIGMEGGHAPRVRFCARPELTVIEIAPGPGPAAERGG
jgi:predicted MPP superfamily phosphohydrolase